MSETTVRVRSEAVGRGIQRVWETGEKDKRYRYGVVQTRDGYVWVYGQEGLTRFGFIHEGREYERTEWRTISHRGTATIAKRFAKDVIAGRVP